MSKQKNKFEELASAYVLNALSKEEERTFVKLLENATEEELRVYEDLKATAAEFATLSLEDAPSTEVKKRILQSIEGKNEPARVLQLSWYRFAAAASVIFILISAGLFFYSQELSQEIEQKSEVIAEQQTTIQKLETEVERKEELLTILEARDVDLVMMAGLEDMSPNGYGKVVWDKESGRALLQVANLPTVPSDKDYQLWFIVNGQPVSAGVFAVNDPQQDNFFKIEQLRSSANQGAFAITMEPKGGVPQPTGDMYLLGNM
jgi:anti-sigma-K factor RskA